MTGPPDYSLLDQEEILEFVFYPRQEWPPPPPGASDHWVPVVAGISISCRFYPSGPDSPSILFFHGNGEVASDYDGIAPLYKHLGINLFVADYRGYGASGGSPTFSAMAADAHAIFNSLGQMLHSQQYKGPLFVMGRSLGSFSALEIAAHYQDRLKGLIAESGFANAARLLKYAGFPLDPSLMRDLEEATLARVRSLTLPVLVIHGEWDTLVPPQEAVSFYQNVGSQDKRLVTIPQAGHNDLMLVGLEQYFSAIKGFVCG